MRKAAPSAPVRPLKPPASPSRLARPRARQARPRSLPPEKLARRRATTRAAARVAGERSRLAPIQAAAPPAAPDDSDDQATLSWLRTDGAFIADEGGRSVALRGMSVALADDRGIPAEAALRDWLALGDIQLEALQNLWGINLIQFRIGLPTLLGRAAIPTGELLDGLFDLVSVLTERGIYLLLSLTNVPGEPDPAIFDAWPALAAPFDSAPGILFELIPPNAGAWFGAAPALIGAVRRVHPASLLFVGIESAGGLAAPLPIRFTTGDEMHNIVYTAALDSALTGFSAANALRAFANDHPVFISDWAGSSDPFDRSIDAEFLLIDSCAVGWTARSWNAPPSAVEDAAAGRLGATRWGRDIQRATQMPLRRRYPPKLVDTPAREERPYPPAWPSG
jgi:hypothetical protein